MTPSRKLLDRLRAMGLDIPPSATIHRTYAGRCQRQASAFSWFINGWAPTGVTDVGGYMRVTELLKVDRLMVSRSVNGYWEVDPYSEDVQVNRRTVIAIEAPHGGLPVNGHHPEPGDIGRLLTDDEHELVDLLGQCASSRCCHRPRHGRSLTGTGF